MMIDLTESSEDLGIECRLEEIVVDGCSPRPLEKKSPVHVPPSIAFLKNLCSHACRSCSIDTRLMMMQSSVHGLFRQTIASWRLIVSDKARNEAIKNLVGGVQAGDSDPATEQLL